MFLFEQKFSGMGSNLEVLARLFRSHWSIQFVILEPMRPLVPTTMLVRPTGGNRSKLHDTQHLWTFEVVGLSNFGNTVIHGPMRLMGATCTVS